MSESGAPKDPRASGGEALPSVPSERDLDAALASAADLAANLANEVRESPPPMPRTGAKDERLALDQELAELERLAHKTASDLGAEGASVAGDGASVADGGESAQSSGKLFKRKKKRPATAVPDFMSEFTGPAPEVAPPAEDDLGVSADAADTVAGAVFDDLAAGAPESPAEGRTSPPAAGSPPPTASQPAFDLEGREVVTQRPKKKKGQEVAVESRAEPPSGAKPTPNGNGSSPSAFSPPPTPQAAGIAGATGGVVGKIAQPHGTQTAAPAEAEETPVDEPKPPNQSGLGKALYPTAERVVAILEKLDRPFGWLGKPIKQAIGWFAIATVFTSVIATIVALLLM